MLLFRFSKLSYKVNLALPLIVVKSIFISSKVDRYSNTGKTNISLLLESRYLV